MSVAYLRRDVLTKLANCGREALDKVEKTTRDLLEEAPGPWMPDEIIASLELVDMAHRDAGVSGKNTLNLVLAKIVADLGRAWLKRPLTPQEGRQLLGAMELGVGWLQDSAELRRSLPKIIWRAKNAAALFNKRIPILPEIAGSDQTSVSGFILNLWNALPSHVQSKCIRTGRRRGLDTEKKQLLKEWAIRYKSRIGYLMEPKILDDLEFFTGRIEGKPGIVEIRVGNRWHLVGMCPTSVGDDALEIAENKTALIAFFKLLGTNIEIDDTLILNAGNIEIHDDNPSNVIEGVYSKTRDRFFDMIAAVTAAQISPSVNAKTVASVLWKRRTNAKVILPQSEADVADLGQEVILKAGEVVDSFEPILTSVPTSRYIFQDDDFELA